VFFGYLSVNQRKKKLNMLELCKQVLLKVSFDRLLFRKELTKAIRWVKGEELIQLKNWCLDQFGERYMELILISFKPTLV
jgi:hypothetical protein